VSEIEEIVEDLEAGMEPETETVEPEVETEEVQPEIAEENTEEKAEEPAQNNDLSELRSLVRTLRSELADSTNELAKLKTTPTQPKQEEPKFRILYDEEGNEVKIPIEQPKQEQQPVTTQYDEAKRNYAEIAQQRTANAETLFEMMKLHPNYADIETVVTKESIDDLHDKLATAHSQRSGTDYNTALLMVKTAILQQPNPYGYMYGILKAAKQEATQAVPAQKQQQKQPPKAPASIADFGDGGKKVESGWTAKRIDEMPEEEWNTIPKDIKEKYMRNELK